MTGSLCTIFSEVHKSRNLGVGSCYYEQRLDAVTISIISHAILKNSVKKKRQEYKCDKCDFAGDTELSFKKHINTKHPIQNNEEHEIKSIRIDCTLDGIEGIEDLF